MNVKEHPFGAFALVSHFLALALVWRTIWILKSAKRVANPLAGNRKNLQLEKIFPRAKYPEKDLYNS